MRKELFVATSCLLLALGGTTVSGQDAEPASIGIDALCGEQALAMSTADLTLDAETAEALDDVLRGLVTLPADPQQQLGTVFPRPPAPGAVVLVETPEGRYFRSIGVADVESCEPLEPTSPFAIGSHTKMFVAAVIYQLQEEGLLSTSDPVGMYIPDEIGMFPRSKDATIDHLLTHTAGLPDYESSLNPDSLGPGLGSGDPETLGLAMTARELIAMTAELQDDLDQPTSGPSEPGGSDWSYANIGFIMLAMIIEDVTGQPWMDAVRERVLEPLGMEGTSLLGGVAPTELGLPTPYLRSPFDIETGGWDYSQADAAGDAVSTAEDMATFVEAYYSGQLFEDPETLEAVLVPAAPGFLLQFDDYRYLHGAYYKYGFLGHGGGTPGFTSDAGYDPDLATTIAVWANASESHAGDGVVHVGHALGLTPSMDETWQEIIARASAE
jgi:D-alanyl-D-alanine carboxypeptidase